MTAESSRKTEAAPPLAPGGCPRCGTRLGQPYKYCPNCAYRLRPDLFPAVATEPAGVPVSQRLVALGGYLLFASMVLLVIFAGVRLFAEPEPPDPVQPQVRRARDPHCLALTLDEFVEVPAGLAFWGAYDPGREYAATGGDEAAAGEKDAAERAVRALATLRNGTAEPDAIEDAREALRAALADLPVRDAIERWAEAFDLAVPQEPVESTPDAYRVDDPFRMSRREVTNDQYFEFLRAWARKSGRPVHRHLIPGGWKRPTGRRDVWRIYRDGEGDLPVVHVSFDAALEFCGWFWEERLGGDPDLVVDLPTWKEYLLAARGDNLTYNYPWGRTLRQGEQKVNLGTTGLWSVVADRKEDEFYNGFLDLVGNAREWVYWENDIIVAAGWSYRTGQREPGQPVRLSTPFSPSGFNVIGGKGEGLLDVGFRPVIRRATSLPSFVPVAAGPVRLRGQVEREGILPPERLDAEDVGDGDDSVPETIEEIRKKREPPVSFAVETDRVERDFEISATEVTNRQYLAFLAEIASRGTKDELAVLVPRGWRRDNLLIRFPEGTEEGDERQPLLRAYDGYYVPWEKLKTLYTPGQENVPVEGVTIEQAEAYVAWLSARVGRRCTIPTVAQYLRAARGDGTAPYPWGDDANDPELSPSCRQEPYFPRAFSLAVSPSRPIVGLAGNVAEFVRDSHADGRLLLAGGFYDLPPRLVTLDCFLDAHWDSVQYVLEPGDWDWPFEEYAGGDVSDTRPRLSVFFTIGHYTGLRVVRLPDPF